MKVDTQFDAVVADHIKKYKNQKLYFVKIVETWLMPIQAQSEEDALKYVKTTGEWKGSEEYYQAKRNFEFVVDRQITDVNEMLEFGYGEETLPWGFGSDGTEDFLLTVKEMFGKRDEYDDEE